jgi:hypothetical protein
MNEFKFLVLTWVKVELTKIRNIGSTWDGMRRNV